MVEKRITSWNEIEALSKNLGKKIKQSDFKPNVLIAIIRGGMVPARILSRELDNEELFALRAQYYDDKKNEKTEKVIITQKLNIDLKGKKVLLVDEIIDSGETLNTICNYLKEFKPKEVRLATLFLKPWALIKPNYFVEETEKWVEFPWE